MLLNPYLTFDGSCEEAFTLYAKLLGGKIEAMIPHADTPAAENVPPEWQSKIIHARLVVGDKMLMGSDAPPERYQPMKGFAVTVGVDTPAEAERIFAALAEKGTVQVPMEPTFFAERFGMLADRYGTPWMILCEKKAA
jgi:PhnB protein